MGMLTDMSAASCCVMHRRSRCEQLAVTCAGVSCSSRLTVTAMSLSSSTRTTASEMRPCR